MKFKLKIKIFFSIVLLVFSFLTFINPEHARAGVAAGSDCNSVVGPYCNEGLFCNLVNKCQVSTGEGGGSNTALQEGETCGESAGSQCDSTKNLVCQNFTCVKGSSSSNNGGGNGSTQMSCPEGLTNQNGICLPSNSPFPKTGIAGSSTLVEIITKAIQFLLFFAGIIAVVFLVLGGYWYMASGGNEELAEKGKKTIVNFVLGLVVIIMAYSIVTILFNTLTTDRFVP